MDGRVNLVQRKEALLDMYFAQSLLRCYQVINSRYTGTNFA